MPNSSKNKRKQKLETKTKSLDDEIEFDVEPPESSDENEAESDSQEEEEENEEASNDETMAECEVELHEVKKEFPDPVDEENEALDNGETENEVRQKRKRKPPDYFHFDDYDTQSLVKKIKKPLPRTKTPPLIRIPSPVKIEEPELGFNLYRESNMEMDEEEVSAAWNALSPREHNIWRKKEYVLKCTQKNGNTNDIPTSEHTKHVSSLNASLDNGDLDLPTHFPDARAEVQRLFQRFVERLMTIKEYRRFDENLELVKRAKTFKTLKELQKEFWKKILNKEYSISQNQLIHLFYNYFTTRSLIFEPRLRTSAWKINANNIRKAIHEIEQEKINEIDDFVYVKTAKASSNRVKIARIKEKFMNGQVMAGCLFAEPSLNELEQICPIYKNNVIMIANGTDFKFKADDIVGKCIVLSFSDYIVARPTDIPEPDVYFCTHIKTSKNRLIQPLVIEELTNVLENYRGEVYYCKFGEPENLIYDNQITWIAENNEIITSEPFPVQIKPEIVVPEPSVQIKTEIAEPEPSVPIKEEIVEEIITSENDVVVKIEGFEDDEENATLTVINPGTSDEEDLEEGEIKKEDQPHEIILYDDTQKIINLADTENVVFVIDKSHVLNQNNTLEDGEVIELD